ncbi:MAG: hypothetical protein JJT82_10475 [Legionellaceae bacterium]|nr:hypothetical protein [Legionellaceae bacterium]
MKEHYYAYKIMEGHADLVCTHSEFSEDKMLDLLQDIQQSHAQGLFWIFKQTDQQQREPLSIIDCVHQRVYYHYSGEVENLDETIAKLSR